MCSIDGALCTYLCRSVRINRSFLVVVAAAGNGAPSLLYAYNFKRNVHDIVFRIFLFFLYSLLFFRLSSILQLYVSSFCLPNAVLHRVWLCSERGLHFLAYDERAHTQLQVKHRALTTLWGLSPVKCIGIGTTGISSHTIANTRSDFDCIRAYVSNIFLCGTKRYILFDLSLKAAKERWRGWWARGSARHKSTVLTCAAWPRRT